ncbi:MAG: alpha/beta fold hydrolase [Acidobacteriota bacterium]|nr:MAG: alpha/beta fold hydrolase [Acidobacteriota bacterium]
MISIRAARFPSQRFSAMLMSAVMALAAGAPLWAQSASADASPDATADPVTPTAAATSSPTRERSISLRSHDDVLLEGVLVLPAASAESGTGASASSYPLAVLIHAFARDRDSLLGFADRLAAAGIAVALLDQRGHGRSRKKGIDVIYTFPVVPADQWKLAVQDQGDLLRELREQHFDASIDSSRVAFVGVGEGALVAIAAASRRSEARAVVLVDAPLGGSGFRPESDIGIYGPRPALLVSSALPHSAAVADSLAEYGHGERRRLIIDSFEQGHLLLNEPAAQEVIQWLAATLGVDPN